MFFVKVRIQKMDGDSTFTLLVDFKSHKRNPNLMHTIYKPGFFDEFTSFSDAMWVMGEILRQNEFRKYMSIVFTNQIGTYIHHCS